MDPKGLAESVKNKYKKTKFYIVSGVLAITVIGSLASPGLTYPQKLLLFGVGGAFGIILEILHSIESRLLAEEKKTEFESLGEALSTIREILKTGRSHKIEVLASDGGYIANYLIPRLKADAETFENELEVQIHLINQNSPVAALMPEHWPKNVETNLKRMMARCDARLRIIPVRYDYLPCVAGILIDSTHLFLGFYAWESPKDLAAAERNHVYYKRGNPKDEKYFTLFESWSGTAPRV